MSTAPRYIPHYTIEDYREDREKENIVKSVHLQAEHDAFEPVRETAWLQAIADNPTSDGFPHVGAALPHGRPGGPHVTRAGLRCPRGQRAAGGYIPAG